MYSEFVDPNPLAYGGHVSCWTVRLLKMFLQCRIPFNEGGPHLLNQYLLNVYHRPETLTGVEETNGNKPDKSPGLPVACLLVGRNRQ